MRLALASRLNAHVYAHWVAACGNRPMPEEGTNVDRIFGSIDFFSHSEKELSTMLPPLDWKKISSVELTKRIIISNLRFQI